MIFNLELENARLKHELRQSKKRNLAAGRTIANYQKRMKVLHRTNVKKLRIENEELKNKLTVTLSEVGKERKRADETQKRINQMRSLLNG